MSYFDSNLNLTMLTDFYELTMAHGYFEEGYKDRITYFDVFYRQCPDGGGFAIAAGLEQIIDYIQELHFSEEDIASHEHNLLTYATEQLSAIEGLTIYGTTADKAPIVSFNVEGCDHYDIGMILDKMGIAIRTGHHCAQPTMERFGVNGMCRASFGLYNTTADIDALAKGVERAVKMLR